MSDSNDSIKKEAANRAAAFDLIGHKDALSEYIAYILPEEEHDDEILAFYYNCLVDIFEEYHRHQLKGFAEWHAKEPFTIDEHKDLGLRVDRYLLQKVNES